MRKYTLSLTLATFLVLSSLLSGSPSVTADETLLTSEEVLEIALSNPDLDESLMNDDYQVYDPYLAGSNRDVDFTLKSDIRRDLIDYVDDETGKVSEIVFNDVDYEEPNYSDEYVDEAISYVQSLVLLIGFIETNPDLLWYGYSYDNIMDVGAYSENYDDYVWLSAQLEMSDVATNVNFTLLSVSSNKIFGSPENDFDEVVELVSDHPEVKEFLAFNNESFINVNLIYTDDNDRNRYLYSIYYSPDTYYGIYNEDSGTEVSESASTVVGNYAWLLLIVEDLTGEVIDVFGTYTATQTEEQILDLVAKHIELSSWINSLDDYQTYVYFDGYDTWWVNFWSTNTRDYGYAVVNDTSGEIIEYYIFIPIPATKTESEIEALAVKQPDVAAWVEEIVDYRIDFYYDAQSNWYVYLYDPVLRQNSASVSVNDVNGKVSDVYTNLIEANLSIDDLYDILRNADLEDFFSTFPDALVYIYYSDYWRDYTEESVDEPAVPQISQGGLWYINIVSPTIIEASIELVVEDETGSIVSRFRQLPAVMPTHDIDEVLDIVNALEEVITYKSNHTIVYEQSYFYDGNWYSWLSGQGENGLYSFVYVTISDKDLEVLSVEINEFTWWYQTAGVYNDFSSQEALANTIGLEVNTEEGIPLTDILGKNKEPLLSLPGFMMFLSLFSLISVVLLKKQGLITRSRR